MGRPLLVMTISFSSGSVFHIFAGEVLRSRTVMNLTSVLLAARAPLCHSIVNRFVTEGLRDYNVKTIYQHYL